MRPSRNGSLSSEPTTAPLELAQSRSLRAVEANRGAAGLLPTPLLLIEKPVGMLAPPIGYPFPILAENYSEANAGIAIAGPARIP